MKTKAILLLLAGFMLYSDPLSAQNFSIQFPDDHRFTTCVSFADWDKPIVVADSGLQVNITYNFQTIDPIPSTCLAYELDWFIAIGDATPATGPIVYVPNPTLYAIVSNPLNLPGPIVSAPGTPAPLTSTISKINPTDQLPTDFSTFWQGPNKVYKYTQHIRNTETVAPVLFSAITSATADTTSNDPALWNQPYWINPIDGSHDLPETSVEIQLEVSDACSKSDLYLTVRVYSDFDGDGVEESVNGPNQVPDGQVWYNNLNGLGSELRIFDNAAPFEQFKVLRTVFGDTARFKILLPPLPYGTHRLDCFVTDICGNSILYTDTLQLHPTVATFEPTKEWLQIQSNPFAQSTLMRFSLPESGLVQYSVFDVAGRQVFMEKTWCNSGWQEKTMGNNWSAGLYFYLVETRHGIARGRLVKE